MEPENPQEDPRTFPLCPTCKQTMVPRGHRKTGEDPLKGSLVVQLM